VDPDGLVKRLVYGVGTRLITSWGDPALGGVYKLVAVEHDGRWVPALKVSESPAKTPNPGHKGVWRVYDRRGKATADLIGLEDEPLCQGEVLSLRHPMDHTKFRQLRCQDISEIEPLLVDVYRHGERLDGSPTLDEMRQRRQADVDRLDPGVRRIMNPHIYHVSLTQRLWDLKHQLISEALAR
jgi:nicotinate phosphoribosyltransferase